MTGAWKTLNLASTNRSVIEEGGAYQCFMTGIVRLANGNRNVTYFHRYSGVLQGHVLSTTSQMPSSLGFRFREGPADTDPLGCSVEAGHLPELPLGDPGDLTGPRPSGQGSGRLSSS